MKGRPIRITARHKKTLLHVLGVVVLLSLPFIPFFQGKSPSPFHPLAIAELISYSLLLLIFYLNYYILVPKIFFRKRYLLYALTVAALYVTFRYARSQVFNTSVFDQKPYVEQPQAGKELQPGPPEEHLPPNGRPNRAEAGDRSSESQYPGRQPPARRSPGRRSPEEHGPDRGETGHYPPNENRQHEYDLFMEVDKHIFPFLVMIAFSFVLSLSGRWQETEAARARAELAYLKAQINPHFLFNTLNSIYSLAITQHEKTPDAVVKLSNMMRYILNESETESTALEKEISYITNYIDLQKMRFGDAFKLTYETLGEFSGKKIEPLILISFIENAFKYGINAEEESDIRIRIAMDAPRLHLHVYNRKVKINDLPENAGGVGLKNTRERLAILYPDAHRLSIQDEPGYYEVNLTITL
ncbi:MAG: sensor histidine kinase [Leadbetterella sp.]|nr:sensor histidine kinase [Leadbetterella sp.]